MAHKSCERRQMSYTADATRLEMQQKVRDVVALAADSSRKAALDFAARVLRLPYDRVRRIYYGQARCIQTHESDQIRAYVEAAHKLIEARARYEVERDAFLAASHPAVAQLAPGPLDGPAVSEADAAAPVAPQVEKKP